MSDDKLPRIPSFAELGISEDEIEELEREIAKEAGEQDDASKPEARSPDPAAPVDPADPAPPADRTAAAGPAPRVGGDASARKQDAAPKAGKTRKRSLFGRRKRRDRASAAGSPTAGGPTASGPPASGTTGGPVRDETDGAPAPVPWRGVRGPVTLLVVVVAAWLSSSANMTPDPVPASAPDTVFSSGRAMTHLHRIAAEAHPPGSPAHAAVRDYLVGELRRLGHEPLIQTTTSVTGGGPVLTAATVRNVVARIPGTQPGGRAVLVTAHYDSRGISRGAGDDGSGLVAILESLRALGTGPGLRNDLIVLFTDAEEPGLLGARAFVDEHPYMQDVALVLAFEMRGGGGASMMFETGAANGWVIEALRQSDPYPSANSAGYEIYLRMPNDTDFTPFKEAGRQGLNFAGVGRPHVYHQAYDAPENLSERTLQHHGTHALAMLRHFGDAELSAVNAPDVSYISIRYLGLVTYGRLWIWVLGVAAVALWTLAFFVGKRGGSRPGRVVLGGVASLAYLGTVAPASYYLYAWRLGAHAEAGALHAGSFHSEGWYVLAIVAFAFALLAAVLPLLRKWCTPVELTVGALLVPTLLAAVTTVMFPMAAVNLQWPVLAGCIGAFAVAGLPGEGRPGTLRWVVALLAVLPVVAVLAPFAENVWLAMGLVLAPAVALLAGLGFLFILPALEVVREPNGWWAPVVGFALAGVFLAVGMSTANPTAARPAPSTLVYTLDNESGSAYWGTDSRRGASDPGVAWAVAAVGPFEPAGSRESAGALESLQAEFTPRGTRYAFATADPVDVPAPTVAVVDDTTMADGVTRVSLSSQIGAEMLLLHLPANGPRLVAVNGKPLRDGERARQVTHWGTPEGALLLDFDRSEAGALELVVVEHHLRPGELVGQRYFMRPADLAPNITTLSDRAMIRTVFTVDPQPDPADSIGAAPVADSTGAAPVADSTVAAPVADTAQAARPDTTRG